MHLDREGAAVRILLIGNAPWGGSGYAEQIALFAPRFVEAGHDVALMANWGLQGAASEWQGFTVYPSDGAMGNKSIGTFMKEHQADCAIFLCDAWVLTPESWPDDSRIAVWAPVDRYPLPPGVFNVLQHEKVLPIAMSRFGEEWMRKFTLDPNSRTPSVKHWTSLRMHFWSGWSRRTRAP